MRRNEIKTLANISMGVNPRRRVTAKMPSGNIQIFSGRSFDAAIDYINMIAGFSSVVDVYVGVRTKREHYEELKALTGGRYEVRVHVNQPTDVHGSEIKGTEILVQTLN